jgi:Raf kinase inhibitor-like YbhB/YbcL family protein
MKIKLGLLTTTLLFLQLTFAQSFTLSSTTLGGQATSKEVFNGFGCKGENLSPQLQWKNAPEGTKSFAITIYDKDAPTGSGWWHWLIFDIPATVDQLLEGAGNIQLNKAPEKSIQSITDFGKPGYGGPCPPPSHGFHQYVITVYALKTDKIGLSKDSNPATVGFTLNANALEKASVVFYYKR